MTVAPRPIAVSPRQRRFTILVGIVVALAIGLGIISTFYTEILWFREVHLGRVFWTSVWTRTALGVGFGTVFALLMLLNLWIARKITNPARMFSVSDVVLERYRATLQPYAKWFVIGGSLAFGLFAGSGATVKWRDWLLYQNASTFGQADPVFGKDLGFFVFKLPFLQFAFTWMFSTMVLLTLAVAVAHYFMGGIRPQARSDRVAPEVRAHLSALLGVIVLLKAYGYRLDQFNLSYSPRGVVHGASYTDVNAQLPALQLLVVIAIACSVFFFLNARVKNWILPIGGIAILALTSVVAGGIYPAAVQRLRVTPNERLREAPFIERNITATRAAFGIDNVTKRPLSAKDPVSAKQVAGAKPTIENIRLWDPKVLVNQYTSVQRIKQYYEFNDVDVDRYQFASGKRQVMLSAREISPNGLSPTAQTWLNKHLIYTHGYGAVASRVDRVTSDGRPDFIIQNIPPVAEDDGPEITEPRIYFGESEEVPFVVVGSEQKELDFPQGDRFAETVYDGEGGVALSSVARRAAFAWRFRDVNLLISSAITPKSRIMFRRTILDRVKRIAPFVELDADPYLMIVDGKLLWMLDGYTTSSMYPYSQRVDFNEISEGGVTGSGNYIRNSVKFVVGAKDGDITGYAWDETDPILRTWQKIFPGLLQPKSAMPAGVLEHVRYPEGLFKLQSDRFASYHILDPSNFYSREDAWLVGTDPTGSLGQAGDHPPVPPYYVLTQLPGEKELSFVLVRPFTPAARANLTAFMVAHSDPGNYGQLVSYTFPKSDSVFGPEQIQARINQDPAVSQQVGFWTGQKSTVIYGNLLIVPIGQSLLYVQPLYLKGTGQNIPELKRVVAVTGNSVKMANTLPEALAAIFKGSPPVVDPGDPGAPAKTLADYIQEAIDHDQAAQRALREGDFATYGREQALMRDALDNAAEASGASPRQSPTPVPS